MGNNYLYKLGVVALLGLMSSCHNYEKEHRIHKVHKVHQVPESESYVNRSIDTSTSRRNNNQLGYMPYTPKTPQKSVKFENKAQQKLMEQRYGKMLENQRKHEELQRNLKGVGIKQPLESYNADEKALDPKIGKIGEINKKTYLEMLEEQQKQDTKKLVGDKQEVIVKGKENNVEGVKKSLREEQVQFRRMWDEYNQLFQSGKYEEVVKQSKNIEKGLIVNSTPENIDKIRRCDLQRMYMLSCSYYALGRYGPAYATATAGMVVRDKHNEIIPGEAIYCPRLDGIAALAAIKFSGKSSAMRLLQEAEKKYETQPKYKAHIHMYKAKLCDDTQRMVKEYQTAVDLYKKAYGDEEVKGKKLYKKAIKQLNKY